MPGYCVDRRFFVVKLHPIVSASASLRGSGRLQYKTIRCPISNAPQIGKRDSRIFLSHPLRSYPSRATRSTNLVAVRFALYGRLGPNFDLGAMWIEKPADGRSEVSMLTFFRCYASAVGSPSRSATEPGDALALCDVAALNRPAAACIVRRSKLDDSVWRETARK